MKKPIRLTFFDRLPSMGSAVTAASVAAPFISPAAHGRPFTLMLVVTRRCNSRCKMCSIWQEHQSPMLSLADYRTMFREPLPSVRALVLTGGEPTLRADLPEIWAIARAALPQLEYGLLATSGLNPERALGQIETIMREIEGNPGSIRRFEVQVSLDGIGEMHDRIRGIPGFFGRVERMLAGLADLEKRYPLLRHKLSCVVLPENLSQIEPVKAFARAQGIGVHFSPAVMSGAYYRNLDGAEALGFVPDSPSGRAAQVAFKALSQETSDALGFYYADAAAMIGGAPRSRTCLMGFFGCVVEHTGEVYPCVNWEHESFGNLLEEPFDSIWFGPRAQAARLNLRRTGCPTCPSMCYPHAVGAGEVISEKTRRIKRRLTRLATRLGSRRA